MVSYDRRFAVIVKSINLSRKKELQCQLIVYYYFANNHPKYIELQKNVVIIIISFYSQVLTWSFAMITATYWT